MTNVTMKSDSFEPATDTAAHLFDNWFDPIESGLRERVREFIEALICGELDAALARPRYGRAKNDDACSAGVVGHRHGSRTGSLTGSFGKTEITVPRARLQTSDGRTTEWHSKALRAYQRRTVTADALIASAYLAGTNTRRVRRALAALFRDAVSKDIVSRVWRKIKAIGTPGTPARWLWSRSCVSFSTAPSFASGSIARPHRSHCSWSSACARTVRRCCSRSNTWVANPPKLGAPFSTI